MCGKCIVASARRVSCRYPCVSNNCVLSERKVTRFSVFFLLYDTDKLSAKDVSFSTYRDEQVGYSMIQSVSRLDQPYNISLDSEKNKKEKIEENTLNSM